MKQKMLLLLAGLMLTTALRAADPVVKNNLIVRYNFENTAGNIVTDAVAGIEAKLMGKASVVNMGDYNALSLPSTNSWLDLTAETGKKIATLANFSISVYYRVNKGQNITTAGNFLWAFTSAQGCSATNGAYTAYRINTQHMANATEGYDSEQMIERGTPSADNRWVSVLYTQTGKTGRLYIDGIFVANNTAMPNLTTLFGTNGPAYGWIGRPPFSEDTYLKNTLVTEFCIYNTALTAINARTLAAECAKLDEAYEHAEPHGTNTALLSEIETAKGLLDAAKLEGGYAPGAVSELGDLINVAQYKASDTTYRQEIYDEMTSLLKAAETTLKNSKGYVAPKAQTPISGNRGFRHPGMLHTAEDFTRIKAQISAGNTSVVKGLDILKKAEWSQSGVQTYPVETIVRGGGVGENYMNAARGATMAYQNALRWKIEGTEANAKAAVRILNSWAKTTRHIGGDSNFALAAGLYGYAFANAAELMRDYSGWKSEDFEAFKRWMLEVWYPSAIDFLRRRNGTWENSNGQGGGRPGHYWSNWGLCNVLCVMSIGILCDDVYIYNQGLSYYKYDQVGTFQEQRGTTINNDGCNEFIGNLVPVVKEDARGPFGMLGQMQESGRDQGHSLMAVGLAVDICQTALNQGDDLYRLMDDRLAAGIEFIAAYNFDNIDNLPWTQYHYCDCRTAWHNGQWHDAPNSSGRGGIRNFWGRVIGYYEGVRGVKMNYSEKALSKMGVDGGGTGAVSGPYDHLGYSVLTCTRPFATKTPTPLAAQMTYDEKTIDGNELGGLKNDYVTRPTQALAPGTVVTLTALLPKDEQDTGNWKWDTGETTNTITITANESRAYRVSYTNAAGITSEQLFTIAVAGSCNAPKLTPEITIDGKTYESASIAVDYGKSVKLSVASSEGYGYFLWDNGKKTQSIILDAVASNRDVNVVFTNSGGLNTLFTFHLTVENVPVISDIKTSETKIRNSYQAIYDLNGHKLTATKKGLNIINGKKVVVK